MTAAACAPLSPLAKLDESVTLHYDKVTGRYSAPWEVA